MVVLLAASSALFFGALAVTIRLALARGVDAEAASLVTTVIAGVICAALAVLSGDFSGVVWRDTWPFFLTGLFAPGISQILFTRSVGVIGPSRTAIAVGISPVLSAATASLVSATLVILLVVVSRPNARERVRLAARPFVPSGLVYGISYACLYSAFDRGRVTIVAPLVATESLFAVLISIVVLRRSERIGPRLLLAAGLVVGGGALISSFR